MFRNCLHVYYYHALFTMLNNFVDGARAIATLFKTLALLLLMLLDLSDLSRIMETTSIAQNNIIEEMDDPKIAYEKPVAGPSSINASMITFPKAAKPRRLN